MSEENKDTITDEDTKVEISAPTAQTPVEDTTPAPATENPPTNPPTEATEATEGSEEGETEKETAE